MSIILPNKQIMKSFWLFLIFFVVSDCLFQHQTVTEQSTKCDGSLEGDHFVCQNPVISYGSVNGGIPQVHGNNDYKIWCEEMGFGDMVGDVQTKQDDVCEPNGWLFGCSSYDNSNWHWCDSQDGYWLNEELDSHGSKERVTQVKCKLKNNEVPGCLPGNYSFIYN